VGHTDSGHRMRSSAALSRFNSTRLPNKFLTRGWGRERGSWFARRFQTIQRRTRSVRPCSKSTTSRQPTTLSRWIRS
jgi:hypothetical protein